MKLHATRALMAAILLSATAVFHGCGRTYEKVDFSNFRHPEATYRSLSFYSLNDSLDADVLRSQLRMMKEGGFGGAFLHSRPGLLTPYLSPEWFDMMQVGVDECRKLGMEAWFYDEDKWPSGFAGGIVPRKSEAYRARTLGRVPKDYPVESPDTVLFEDASHKYICHVERMGTPWYNGTCWVDLMNPEAVAAFLDCTYRPYVERFAGQKGVFGFFSDEPQISPRRGWGNYDAVFPYSPWMEAAFREMWGYEMDPHLPELVEETGDWRTFRLHYYRTVAACMEKAFSKQIGTWCEEHGMMWTGHYNGEEHPTSHMLNEGATMQQYRWMTRPGIDALGLKFKELHNIKGMSSVADQYGKERRVVEIFGISGHNLSYEDRMWITAYHTLNGANMLCPHLTLYSMKGLRKRDYPPTFGDQEPWWSENARFEDFAGRLCWFAATGKPVGDVCVLSTIESDYITFDARQMPHESNRDVLLERVLNLVTEHHRNVAIGDEQILSEVGSVEGDRLRIGKMTYRTVILPSLLTIRPSTLALLEDFAAAGGQVIICGQWPEYVEGQPAALAGLHALVAHGTVKEASLESLGAILDANAREFTLQGEQADMIWTHLREVNSSRHDAPAGRMLQLSNTSRLDAVSVQLQLAGDAPYRYLLNPLDGQILSLPEGESMALHFAPAQTWLLYFGPQRLKADGAYVLPGARTRLAVLDGFDRVRRLDPNALPLDFAAWSTDGGQTWQPEEPVLAIYQRFERDLDYNGPLKLRFSFDIHTLPERCSLAVEQPWMYLDITVNGHQTAFTHDTYIDHIIRLADIASFLQSGRNTVLMDLDFVGPQVRSFTADKRYGSEIEAVYLVGDFAVNGSFAADQPAETWRNRGPRLQPKPMPTRFAYGTFALDTEPDVVGGDFTRAGYPFYAGRMACDGHFTLPEVKPGVRYKLVFPEVESILVHPEVNGKALDPVFCSPWETDITEAVRAGENRLTLTLTGSLRNLMGPSHHVGGEFFSIGPGVFTGDGDWPNLEPGDKDWYERRKTGDAKLWRDDYYCIPFGFRRQPELVLEQGEREDRP